MKGGRDLRFYLRKVVQGLIASFLILAIYFVVNRDEEINQNLLNEIIREFLGDIAQDNDARLESANKIEYIDIIETPFDTTDDIANIENQSDQNDQSNQIDQYNQQVGQSEMDKENESKDIVIDLGGNTSDVTVEQSFRVTEIEATYVSAEAGIIGLDDVIYQPDSFTSDIEGHFSELPFDDIEKLKDMNYLLNNFYLIDPKAGVREGLIDPVAFLEADMKLKRNIDGPQVLVFHTHSQELYKDSVNVEDGIMGAGKLLCQILENKYGIKTIHDVSTYDLIDGKSHILGAYERMEPNIMRILKENPTIEVIIDLHRDGVLESIHLVDMINGKSTAQIMFFNGLSTLNENGQIKDVSSLPNTNLKSNLAFSFQMQLAANQLFEGLTRKVYLRAYRYSLHMLPKSLLIEVGAQTNTKEEAFNAMEPLADILARVVL